MGPHIYSRMSSDSVSTASPQIAAAQQYINVATMFSGVKPEFKKLLLSHKLELQYALEKLDPNAICPRVENIMHFARFADLSEIRVCIIGQDPYNDINHAHGLAFSTLDAKLPGSLKNIFTCLVHHGHISRDAPLPKGDLSAWARSGVLLLNTALTTAPGYSDAHKDIWSGYMHKIISSIGHLDQPIVYFLWGNHAQKYAPVLLNCGKSLILHETHPSPIGQARLPDHKKFMYCDHFNRANEFLTARGFAPINWNPGQIYTAPVVEAKCDTSVKNSENNIVYTDGSASENGNGPLARAGYAAYFTSGPLTGLKLVGRIGPVQMPGEEEFIFPSNIRGEGFAIIRALEAVLALPEKPMVEVVTDSEFWINMIKIFMPRWVNNGTPWASKKNPDMTRLLWKLVCDFEARAGSLILRHVYSHGKDKHINPIDKKWNDYADKLAGEARNSAEFFESAKRD